MPRVGELKAGDLDKSKRRPRRPWTASGTLPALPKVPEPAARDADDAWVIPTFAEVKAAGLAAREDEDDLPF